MSQFTLSILTKGIFSLFYGKLRLALFYLSMALLSTFQIMWQDKIYFHSNYNMRENKIIVITMKDEIVVITKKDWDIFVSYIIIIIINVK